MSVQQEANGRRSVQVEFAVSGTQEEVWQAIATGPGISSWFVPAAIEERDGKPVAIKYQFNADMEIHGVLTAWDPPRMFAAQQLEGWGDAPLMTTEWHVTTRACGGCLVRMVHCMVASTDEWDAHLEGATAGWSGFLSILRVYLAHFRGQRGAIMQVTTPIASTEAEAWETLTVALGVKGVRVGQRWATPAGVSPLAGVVEAVTENPFDALLRLDTPVPGIAALGTATCGECVVAMNLYLYGDQAAATVAREKPVWQAWLKERFPMPTGT